MSDKEQKRWRQARSAGLRRRTAVPRGKSGGTRGNSEFDGRRRLAFRQIEEPEFQVRNRRKRSLRSRIFGRRWDVTDSEAKGLETADARLARLRLGPRSWRLPRPLWAGRAAAAGLVLVLAGLLLVFLRLGRRETPVLPPAAAEDTEILRIVNRERVEAFFRAYYGAGDWRERLAWVRHPDRTAPRMEAYYRTRPLDRTPLRSITRIGVLANAGEEFAFAVGENAAGDPVRASFAMENGELRLDWESMVGYSEATLEELVRDRPPEPVLVRVALERGDYFNYGFEPSSHACYRIRMGASDEACYAYLKGGDPARALIDDGLLRRDPDGRGGQGLLFPALEVRARPEGPDPRQLEIVRVISLYWLLGEEED